MNYHHHRNYQWEAMTAPYCADKRYEYAAVENPFPSRTHTTMGPRHPSAAHFIGFHLFTLSSSSVYGLSKDYRFEETSPLSLPHSPDF